MLWWWWWSPCPLGSLPQVESGHASWLTSSLAAKQDGGYRCKTPTHAWPYIVGSSETPPPSSLHFLSNAAHYKAPHPWWHLFLYFIYFLGYFLCPTIKNKTGKQYTLKQIKHVVWHSHSDTHSPYEVTPHSEAATRGEGFKVTCLNPPSLCKQIWQIWSLCLEDGLFCTQSDGAGHFVPSLWALTAHHHTITDP